MKITRTINGQEIAIELTVEEMRKIYYEIDKEYLQEDVKQWAEDAGKELNDKLLEDVIGELDSNYNSDLSHWENISSAYNWIIYQHNK